MPADYRGKVKVKEGKKMDEYFDLAKKLKNLWNMKVTMISIVVGTLGPQKSAKETHRSGNTNYLDHSTCEIGSNTSKSPGNLRGLAVIQTPVEKKHQF